MNKKVNYLIKRTLSALIDLFVYAIVGKMIGFIWNNGEGETSVPLSVAILLYYLVFFVQEFFFNKTIGKFLFKLELVVSDEHTNLSFFQRFVRLLFRRVFDIFELICPFLYVIFILVNKRNQKLGDFLTGVSVVIK